MVTITPESIPYSSFRIFTMGARQFVVQEALLTMSSPSYVSSLTPITIVFTRSSPFAGADMITFFAPAWRCVDACSFVLKMPVDSITTSTLRSFQGN